MPITFFESIVTIYINETILKAIIILTLILSVR